jgi:hypothetical protein
VWDGVDRCSIFFSFCIYNILFCSRKFLPPFSKVDAAVVPLKKKTTAPKGYDFLWFLF